MKGEKVDHPYTPPEGLMVNIEGMLFKVLLCSHTETVTVHVVLGNRAVLSSLMYQ